MEYSCEKSNSSARSGMKAKHAENASVVPHATGRRPDDISRRRRLEQIPEVSALVHLHRILYLKNFPRLGFSHLFVSRASSTLSSPISREMVGTASLLLPTPLLMVLVLPVESCPLVRRPTAPAATAAAPSAPRFPLPPATAAKALCLSLLLLLLLLVDVLPSHLVAPSAMPNMPTGRRRAAAARGRRCFLKALGEQRHAAAASPSG